MPAHKHSAILITRPSPLACLFVCALCDLVLSFCSECKCWDDASKMVLSEGVYQHKTRKMCKCAKRLL